MNCRIEEPRTAQSEYTYRGYQIKRGLFNQALPQLSNIKYGIKKYLEECFEFQRRHHPALLSNGKLCEEFQERMARGKLSEQLAVCLALGGRSVFDHSSVAINSQNFGYQALANHPILDQSLLEAIVQNETLIDHLRLLLNSEDVFLTAKLQPVVRLSSAQLDLMDQLMLTIGLPKFESQRFLAMHAIDSPWHNHYGFSEIKVPNTRVLNLCVPLEKGTFSNGCYRVLPESHLIPGRLNPMREEVRAAQEVELKLGDGFFFNNHLFMDNADCEEKEESFAAIILQFVDKESSDTYPQSPCRKLN